MARQLKKKTQAAWFPRIRTGNPQMSSWLKFEDLRFIRLFVF